MERSSFSLRAMRSSVAAIFARSASNLATSFCACPDWYCP
jgi:hypothetical protein